MKKPKKSAFSLIELSIVLVILGLLVAGVTGGSALVKAAQLRSIITESQQIKTSVKAFYTLYNALPGDYNSGRGDDIAFDASPATSGIQIQNGNGDGYISYTVPSSTDVAAFLSESANAKQALRSFAGYNGVAAVPVVPATTPPTFGGENASAPASKIKNTGWVFDYRNDGIDGINRLVESPQNVVVLTGTDIKVVSGEFLPVGNPHLSLPTFFRGTPNPYNIPSNDTSLAKGAISSKQAAALDEKYDDGHPSTGTIRGINPEVAWSAFFFSPNYWPNCFYSTSFGRIEGTQYSKNPSYKCAVSISVD